MYDYTRLSLTLAEASKILREEIFKILASEVGYIDDNDQGILDIPEAEIEYLKLELRVFSTLPFYRFGLKRRLWHRGEDLNKNAQWLAITSIILSPYYYQNVKGEWGLHLNELFIKRLTRLQESYDSSSEYADSVKFILQGVLYLSGCPAYGSVIKELHQFVDESLEDLDIFLHHVFG